MNRLQIFLIGTLSGSIAGTVTAIILNEVCR